MFPPGKATRRYFLIALASAMAIAIAWDGIAGGPCSRWLAEKFTRRDGLVAKVGDLDITRSQLDRAVSEKLWLEGTTLDAIPPEKQSSIRKAALDELIDREILRLKVKESGAPITVTDEEINERLRRLLGRFESRNEMEATMKSQGIADETSLRDRIAALLQQETFIEARIAPAIRVSDDEAKKWFDENRSKLATPERIEARHVFLPTLDHPPEEAKATLDAALADLTAKKKDFATLAREISEDPATKENGGSLGWMTRARLPVDFSAPLFSLPANQPALIRTRLGWHLVEVTGRKPAEERSFERAKPEIIAALQAVKRRQTIKEEREKLRRDATDDIRIFLK